MAEKSRDDAATSGDQWKLTAEQSEALSKAPSQEQMHDAAARGEPREWHAIGLVSPVEDRRHDRQQGWRLYWKLPSYTYGAGIPGIMLILLQFLFVQDSFLQQAVGGMAGLIRLFLIILGGILIGIGAPLWRPVGWTPQLQEKLDDDREYFKKKRGL